MSADLSREEREAFAEDLNAATDEFNRGLYRRGFRRLAVLVAHLADIETDTESFWAEAHCGHSAVYEQTVNGSHECGECGRWAVDE